VQRDESDMNCCIHGELLSMAIRRKVGDERWDGFVGGWLDNYEPEPDYKRNNKVLLKDRIAIGGGKQL